MCKCIILLKEWIESLGGHFYVETQKRPINYLLLISFPIHSTTFPLWIIENDNWPLFPISNASLYYKPYGWLIKCGYCLTIIRRLVLSYCKLEIAWRFSNINIALIWPNNSFEILIRPVLEPPCKVSACSSVILWDIQLLLLLFTLGSFTQILYVVEWLSTGENMLKIAGKIRKTLTVLRW